MIVQKRASLSLAEWFAIFGMHPLHSFQLGHDRLMPITSACNALVYEKAWQGANAAGREEINSAIRNAEEMLTNELGYAPAPVFECDELAFPRFHDLSQPYGRAVDQQGRYMPFELERGFVRALGTESLTHLGVQQITFEDLDNDGIKESFKLTQALPVGVTDPYEVCIYFTDTDRWDATLDADAWRIEPIKVSINAGVATITGSVGVLVRPVLYQALVARMLDVTDPATFAGAVDVYRRCVDTSVQGEFIWEARPGGCSDCPTNTNDPAGYASLSARFNVRDAELGVIAGDASYTNDGGTYGYQLWCRSFPPERLRVNYFAGATTQGRRMAHHFALMVARLAAAEIARGVCGCNQANRELELWQVDLSEQPASPASNYQIGPDVLSNPFGTRRGHVYAYQQAQMFKIARGFIN